MRNGGVLLAGSVFQMAWQATESDAALISMNAAWRGLWNSWCSSARRQSARIASAVDLHKVNADCLGRLCRASSGCNLARKTCTKNFPDTDFWKLFYFSDNSTAWITLITVSWSWRACTQHHVNPELNWNWTEVISMNASLNRQKWYWSIGHWMIWLSPASDLSNLLA